MSKKKSSKTNGNGNGKPNKKKRLPASQFVSLWQKAESMDALAEQTGLAKISLSARAANYRKRGIELRKFPSGHAGPRIDVAALSALAKEHAPAKA